MCVHMETSSRRPPGREIHPAFCPLWGNESLYIYIFFIDCTHDAGSRDRGVNNVVVLKLINNVLSTTNYYYYYYLLLLLTTTTTRVVYVYISAVTATTFNTRNNASSIK